MSDTNDVTPAPDSIRGKLSQFAETLKAEFAALDIGDDIKAQMSTRIDQLLDEIGAKI